MKGGFPAVLGRLLSTALLVAMLAGVLYLHFGTPPFAAIASGSMEPTLHQGDLVLVAPVDPNGVRVGDVVAVRVPAVIQENHRYPPAIVHRVVEVSERADGRTFRLQGDNNAHQDPFTVLPGDLQGEIQQVIPHVGWAILFLHSPQGLAFLAAVVILYLLYMVTEWLELRARSFRDETVEVLTGIVAVGVSRAQVEGTVQRGPPVEEALERFAMAMEEYAVHLQSHTSAVQGLSDGAGNLNVVVERQHQVLNRLAEVLSETSPVWPGRPVAPGRARERDDEDPEPTLRLVAGARVLPAPSTEETEEVVTPAKTDPPTAEQVTAALTSAAKREADTSSAPAAHASQVREIGRPSSAEADSPRPVDPTPATSAPATSTDDPAARAALRVLERSPALQKKQWQSYVDTAGDSLTACAIDFEGLKAAAASWGPDVQLMIRIAEETWHEHRKFYKLIAR